jgi:hypothetical protein
MIQCSRIAFQFLTFLEEFPPPVSGLQSAGISRTTSRRIERAAPGLERRENFLFFGVENCKKNAEKNAVFLVFDLLFAVAGVYYI